MKQNVMVMRMKEWEVPWWNPDGPTHHRPDPERVRVAHTHPKSPGLTRVRCDDFKRMSLDYLALFFGYGG